MADNNSLTVTSKLSLLQRRILRDLRHWLRVRPGSFVRHFGEFKSTSKEYKSAAASVSRSLRELEARGLVSRNKIIRREKTLAFVALTPLGSSIADRLEIAASGQPQPLTQK